MILPCPEDVRLYQRYPLTLTLVALNVFIFILVFSGMKSTLSSSPLLEREGLTLTGRLYSQFVQTLPAQTQAGLPGWVREVQNNDPEQLGVLGAFALRDSRFVSSAEKMAFYGDEVQIAQWQKDFASFRAKYQEQILYKFGLSSIKNKPIAWLTYQFSHSNWIHLLSNISFLILIGAAVEALAGSGMLLLVYVLGGFSGGWGFLLSDAHGTVPMVGASASVSALLAFYCVAETRLRIRFLYFVSPMPGQYGPIYLPTLLIIPLFLLVDLANLWATPEGFGGGVAYAAHLGGTVFGLLFGMLFRASSVRIARPL